MGNCFTIMLKKNEKLNVPLLSMSEIANQVNNLQETNDRISKRLSSIETTMSNSYGEMQIKINKVA